MGKKKMNNKEWPLVSIVIPTYNRKRMLSHLLNSILESNYPKDKLEIIIIDDASNDSTKKFVQEFINKNKYLRIRYVRHDKPQLIAKSRNDGILLATHDLIFFVDDDNILEKNCIRKLVEIMTKYEDVGVAGPVTYYLQKPDIIQYAGAVYSRFMRRTIFLYQNVKDDGNLLKGKIINVDGIANSYMIRKHLALKAGLIPWQRIPWNGEDGYLQYKIKKMGYRVIVVGDAKIYHNVPLEHTKKYNEMRLYYALRSKIIFHRDLDSKFHLITFLLSLPIYVFWYSYVALNMKKNKIRGLKAIVEGLIDGLFGKGGLKYV